MAVNDKERLAEAWATYRRGAVALSYDRDVDWSEYLRRDAILWGTYLAAEQEILHPRRV